MLPCPYCPFISKSGESNRGHIRHYHHAESRANSIRRAIDDATDDSLEYCDMCKLHVLKAQIRTPSGLQRAHDSSTCHKQNMAHRVTEQHNSSGQRSGDDDDDDGNWDGGGNEDDDLSHETYGDSEESEFRTSAVRIGLGATMKVIKGMTKEILMIGWAETIALSTANILSGKFSFCPL